ncbi:endonuclease III domain-containing protein [Streptacidiphilus jiangxiensis]|uniref:DNA-(apurinic or apyrimidinic site) lyase n=1 Tax=Streptacidiphilus jiangxiensis TaxID=235985 RepID=A0A1H8BGZ0_STRJI|nr:endonuclease III domain-containing protein [Streptacidiphilus jiangxiensis]SEM81394.1 3-methyladenine DNA glycosylase/8-oxoguanine DNA glycosylase [Streptacidiphilus jiangxiensis]
MTPRHLDLVDTIELPVPGPFDRLHTLWKPSHFATGLEVHTATTSWRTFRVEDLMCGVRLHQEDPGVLVAAVHTDGDWKPDHRTALARRLATGYGLQEDPSAFTDLAARVPAMREPLAALAGMRQSCPENLFEIATVALLLQNTTIARTTQMMRNLLTHYGHLVHFDGVTLRTFFTPGEISSIPTETFKEVDRLGYRAKSMPAYSVFFTANNLDALGDDPSLTDRFQEIKGVGPYTAGVIASHASRDPAAVGLDVWNTKLLGRRLLGTEDVTQDEVRKKLGELFPGHQGTAALYLVEHEYLAAPVAPLLDPEDLTAWNQTLEAASQ